MLSSATFYFPFFIFYIIGILLIIRGINNRPNNTKTFLIAAIFFIIAGVLLGAGLHYNKLHLFNYINLRLKG